MKASSNRARMLAGTASFVLAGALLTGSAAAQTIKFSYPVARESTMGQTVDRFVELVEEKSDGALKVRAFPSAQIGNEIDSISSAQGGIIEMAVTTTAGLAALVPEFNLFNLPFQFASYEQLDEVTRSPVGEEILAELEGSGLKGLCFWDYGFRNITNNKRPVTTLEDVKGLRVRTIQNGVYIDSLAALGINPTPLPFPETFTALETGAIDGNEIANDVTRAASFYDVQDYLTETKHFTTISVVYASMKLWDRLDETQRTAIAEACAEASGFNRDIINEGADETLTFLKEKGMQVDEISEENLAAFREAVQPVKDKVNAGLPDAIVARFYEQLEASAD